MRVIAVPTRLIFAVLTLFFCVPLAALEVVIATRAPYWKLPYQSMGYWGVAFLLICVPLSAWLLSAKKWALNITSILSFLWVLTTAGLAIRTRYPAMGYFTLF